MRKLPDNHCYCGKKIGRPYKTCVQHRTFPTRQTGRDPVKVKRHHILWNERRKLMRKSIIEMLGSKCCRCGFNDIRALQIDHVSGDGFKERREIHNDMFKFYNLVMQDFEKGGERYQLLCANCNWIKRSENNEVVKPYKNL